MSIFYSDNHGADLLQSKLAPRLIRSGDKDDSDERVSFQDIKQ
ncbi:MAG: hypothetical protein OFPII_10410 [Osedax symbiont Rs1]|nr:MAG: hypothetical protein OFPII_10410 [Osedax symbiont Rs1]